MLAFIVKSFPYVSFPNSGHLLSFFWHDYNKNLAQTYCQPPPRHCGGTVSASEAISPPDWTSYIESIVENVVFKELVILNRTCLFYWALYLKPVLTLVNILNEMTSQPVGRKYLWLLTVQKKELHIVGRRRNPSTDGICAGEDPCNVCLMLHNKRAPSIGRDPRFPHYPYFWGLPYLKETAILPPSLLLHPRWSTQAQLTQPPLLGYIFQPSDHLHSAMLSSLMLITTFPGPEKIFHVRWVGSAEVVGNKHFPWYMNSM